MQLTGRTIINVCLTVVSTVSQWTFASVTAWAVHAVASISAGVLFAFIDILTALFAYTLILEQTVVNKASLYYLFIFMTHFF